MKWLIKTFGFNAAMMIEDGFTLLAGFIVGSVVTLFVVLNAFKNMRRDERVGKAASVFVDGQQKVNPSSLHDYYDIFGAYLSNKLFGRSLKVRNAAFARILMVIFWVLCALCAYIGFRFFIIVSPNG